MISFLKDEFQILVLDSGIGIPHNEQAYIYEPFFRAKNVGSIQGNGLGLEIVKDLVLLNNGYINFESKENQGTLFSVGFPYI